MSKENETITWPHADLLKDNSVNIAELPTKVQEKLAKFPSLTDKDAQEAMDEQLYGAIDDFLEERAKKEKEAKVKEKVKAHKEKKKAGIDVSQAATAKTPEQLAAEKSAEDAKNGKPAEKKGGLMDFVFGRK